MKSRNLLLNIVISTIIAIAIFSAYVLADNGHNFTEIKKLIDSGISCSNLSNEQLEEIGDYYMEQMHPGEAHEMMHKMMGGEDSETTKLMHINMAKGIYCGENIDMNSMMCGGMMGSGGMMEMMNREMMRKRYSNYSTFTPTIIISWIFSFLILIILILLIVWMIKQISKNGK